MIPVRSSAPGRAPLGINAKSIDRPDARKLRYRLKTLIEQLLYNPDLDKQERVCTCCRRRKGAMVRVLRNKETGRAHFNGLESCSNVWLCPLCSLLITEDRRRELQAAINIWKQRGKEVYLMTLTMPHVRRNTLEALIFMLRRAVNLFCQSKRYRQISTDVGRIGNIRALEVTWGSWHGWHPHFHILVFADPGQLATLKQFVPVWIDMLLKVGAANESQRENLLHGRVVEMEDGSITRESPACDIQNGDYAAEYVAKYGQEPSLLSQAVTGERWGSAREMVKGQTKVARRMTGRTAFSLLLDYERGNAQAGELFREFATVMKDKRQLCWSRKLREKLGLDSETADAEIIERLAAELQQTVEQVAELNGDEWKLVVSHGARFLLLQMAELGGSAGVAMLLRELRGRAIPKSAAMASFDGVV